MYRQNIPIYQIYHLALCSCHVFTALHSPVPVPVPIPDPDPDPDPVPVPVPVPLPTSGKRGWGEGEVRMMDVGSWRREWRWWRRRRRRRKAKGEGEISLDQVQHRRHVEWSGSLADHKLTLFITRYLCSLYQSLQCPYKLLVSYEYEFELELELLTACPEINDQVRYDMIGCYVHDIMIVDIIWYSSAVTSLYIIYKISYSTLTFRLTQIMILIASWS